MSQRLLAPGAQPCVWMIAGQLSYRLCTRNYDCAACPLDAALRDAGARGEPRPGDRAVTCPFPDDRLYAPGHTWIQPVEPDHRNGLWRMGVDAFAAAFIGEARGVRWFEDARVLREGSPVCTLDVGLGSLTLTAPVPGQVVTTNLPLRRYPHRVVSAPYTMGWLVELAVEENADLLGLLSASSAQELSARDVWHFRRSVALSLLDESIPDWLALRQDVALTDVRWLLGGKHYVEVLGALVH